MNRSQVTVVALALIVGILGPMARADEFGGTDDPSCSADVVFCELPAWSSGVDFVFVKPHFEQNVAFTRLESDGVSRNTIDDTEFAYDFELSPRFWTHYEIETGIGVRGTFWRFDQASGVLSSSPPANGFGRVSHPVFGPTSIPAAGVDISSTIPTDTFSARSGLDAYTLDLEVTKRGAVGNWQMMASAGVRYARIGQNYEGTLVDDTLTVLGVVDYKHANEGFGPTVAIETRRDLGSAVSLFAQSRASLLMGDSDSQLYAGEDLDLTTPFFTRQTTTRDDVLPILEGQIGAVWHSANYACGQFLVRSAFEGQWWGGVGSASSEVGDLGFLGFTAGIGLTR